MRHDENRVGTSERGPRPIAGSCGDLIRRAAGMRAAGRVRGVALAVGGAGLFAAGATVAGVAVAGPARPAASGTISGCVNRTTRVLTVPRAGQSCPAGTKALQWSVQGPPGPGGPTGPAGPPGPSGLGVIDSGPRFHIAGPDALAFDGTHIWVSNFGGNSVTEINASDGSFVQNLSGGSYNFAAPDALLFDGSHIWVANEGNSVTEFNASDGSFVRNVSGSSYNFNDPSALAFDGIHIWVTNPFGNSVTEINASDGSFVQNFSGGLYNHPEAVLFDGTHIWVANRGDNSVTELTTGGAFVQHLSGTPYNFSNPVALAFSQVRPIITGHLWVVNFIGNGGNGSVTELQTGTSSDGSFVQVVGDETLGQYNFQGSIAATATRNQVWVANEFGDSVTEFNAANGSWVRTITGPSYGLFQPDAVVATPTGVWVANLAAGSVVELPLG